MKIFLDTLSLFKLYHTESDTVIVERVFTENKVTTVFLSELAKIEFESTVWKKVRTQQINESDAIIILNKFAADLNKFTFIQIDSIVTEQAKRLITKYGIQGLRTLDSLQLSTALTLKAKSGLFITTDKLLQAFFRQESLPTEMDN